MRAVRIGAVGVAALAAALLPAPAVGQDPPTRTFAFLSRADGAERERLAEFGHCLDVVAPNWYALERPTAEVAPRPPDEDVLRLTRAAGAELWPVVNADLTAKSASLARERVRARLARMIAAVARRYSYPGMTLDLEGVAPTLRSEFTDLVRRTDARLAAERRRLAVYVPRRTAAPPNDTAAPYDWPALARTADLILASGYNEHWAGGPPGPITTSAGFAAVLDYAAAASRRRVAPTLGAFGYLWPHAGGRARLIPATAAESDPLAAMTGIERDGEVNYTTPEGVAWSETAAGLVARADAAAAAGFRWLGLFSLGREPRSFWAACADR